MTFFRHCWRWYATRARAGHHKARLYHIHYKPLYRAIGEPNNRHRRPTPLPRAIERLMLLDAVLADRERTWLATEQDKLAYFTLTHRVPRQDLPSLTFRAADAETVRYFPEKLPIGLDPDGRTHIFLYLLTQDVPIDFRRFLERHGEVLRALPAWIVRLLVPCHKADASRSIRPPFANRSAHRCVRPSLRICAVTFTRVDPRLKPHERFDQALRASARPGSALYRPGWKAASRVGGDVVVDDRRRYSQTWKLECQFSLTLRALFPSSAA